MISPALLRSCAIAALAVPSLAAAQDSGNPQDETAPAPSPVEKNDPDIGGILVLGERLRSQIDTEQAPILELNQEDIAAYGASSIADLLAAIEPQTGSSRGRGGGRPVFLINGVRVGSFREFRSYPPEAIEKMEVLPEETAQKLGFPPDRRVVNFILKDNFSAITGAAEYEQPDRGGYSVSEQELTLLKITKGGRINLNLQANDTSLLTEAERGIIQTPGSEPAVAGDPDPAAYRSLIADTSRIQAEANFAKAFISTGSSISLNGTVSRSNSLSLSGLDSVILTNSGGDSLFRTLNANDPLERRVRTDVFSTSGSMSRALGSYMLTMTANASLTDSQSKIDRRADVSVLSDAALAGSLAIDSVLPALPDAGFDVVSQKTYAASSKATLSGSPVFLPAGELGVTLDLGFDWNRIDSDDSRAGSALQLTRGDLSGGLNISVPLTSTRDDFLAALGNITLSGQAGFNKYSDFGTLYRWSAGLNWSPADSLDMRATYVWREVPPSLDQLGSLQINNFNVATFDFSTGDTALVTVTSGGNPLLKAETQSDWNFSANWEFVKDARFQLSYSRNRSNDVSSSFPFLTPEIEAAFPDRVTRDSAGLLTALDRRPVDFFESRTELLNFGLTINGTIGKAPERQPDPPAGGVPAAGLRGDRRARPDGAGRAGSNMGPGGEMSEERRAAFMAFRERLCAEDGDAFLQRLLEAVQKGEALAEFPDFDPERARRMLARVTVEDGSIDPQKLSEFRTMICSSEGGPGGRGPRGENGQAPGSGSRGGGGNRGPRFGPGGGDARARYFFNLTHNVDLKREILVAPGGPLLDLLGGDSLSSTGNSINSSRLEAGLFKGGFGMRLSGTYIGSARIDGTGAVGSTNLFIGDMATFDLRLFADLGTALKKEKGIFKGMRVAFKVDNLFDGRRSVRDSNGDTPLSYQPLLLDPTGRYLGVDLRKQF